MIHTFVYTSTILFLVILLPSKTGEFSSFLNLTYTIIYFLLVSFFLTKQKRFTNNWIRFDVFFLIGFTIVHIQIPALASLGIDPTRPDFIWINKNVVNFATWLSVIAITFWMWGYSSYKIKNKINPNNTTIIKKENYLIFDCLLVCIFLLFILVAGSALFSGIYDGGQSWGDGAEYFYLLLNIFIYLRIIYFFKEIPKSSSILTIFKSFLSNNIFFTIILIYILIFLFVGDRGPVFRVLLIISGAYTIFIKPINFKKLVFFIIIGAFILTILGLGRGRDASNFGNQNIFERGYSAFNESENIIITDELAGSNRILYMALDTVPEKHSYLYGITYYLHIAGTIPFLAGNLVKNFDIPKKYRGTSNFFTEISLGPYSNVGVGSEVIADIYVNFGIYGIFIIMFLFGRFSAKSYSKATSLNINYIIIYLCLLAESLSINRGLLLYPLKPIVYMLLLNYLFSKLKK